VRRACVHEQVLTPEAPIRETTGRGATNLC
jgi:hypothetical protein